MNKTVVITGASRGIGRAAAKLFSQNGYNIAAIYNKNKEAADSFLAETDPSALHTLLIQCDISDPTAVKSAADKIIKTFGKVDVLINNAGIAGSGLLCDTSDEDWRRMFAVNVDGMFYCCRAFLPDMIRRKSGKIINLSSIWGMTGAACEVGYSASKAAVIGFTKALAKEVGPSEISVNCVAPGVIDTEMNAAYSEEDTRVLKEETPLGRIGTPEEIANTIYFLAGENAAFITGQIISPNGGFCI